MESNKKQNIIIVLLSVIIVLLLCVIGFLVFDNNKFSNDKVNNSINSEVNNETNINDDSNEVEVNYPDWMKHILNSDIKSVTLTRTYNINSDSSNTSDVNLTNEDLENLFVKLKDYNLIKYNTTGIGVPENQLVISYDYNGKNYNLSFYDGSINVNNGDEKLINLFNNGNYTDNTGTNPGGIMFKFDDSYNGNMYDSYFQD